MMNPQVTMLGGTVVKGEPSSDLRKKLGILSTHLDATLVTSGDTGRRSVDGVRIIGLPRLRPPALGGLFYYLLAPVIALGRTSATGAIVCQSPFEAFGVLVLRSLVPRGRRPAVVVEIHGDWRTATRHYGSALRRLLSPLADTVARWSVRRADRVRAVGPTMAELAREAGFRRPVEVHVTFSDFELFLGRPAVPMPKQPQVAFVGVLQPYKRPRVLLEAWPAVVRSVPGVKLVIAGDGPLREELEALVARLGVSTSVRFVGHVERSEVTRVLDESSILALPSVSEGLPRIALEAMARGRPVVGAQAGGIPDIVVNGESGRLVPPGDVDALAAAITELLGDSQRLSSMGESSRRRAEAFDPAAQFEAGVSRLADFIRESPWRSPS